ncbi:unnamed protein product [Sphenostylis stenocarpa]|uniref:Uncharacterized protein n=1 Tax=Sphenostylis stenocarpa TaxID=92480 RepID=A0AA86W115_9FABA|nr:unnamed protein product [Sphenostylis stenocarpa]
MKWRKETQKLNWSSLSLASEKIAVLYCTYPVMEEYCTDMIMMDPLQYVRFFQTLAVTGKVGSYDPFFQDQDLSREKASRVVWNPHD